MVTHRPFDRVGLIIRAGNTYPLLISDRNRQDVSYPGAGQIPVFTQYWEGDEGDPWKGILRGARAGQGGDAFADVIQRHREDERVVELRQIEQAPRLVLFFLPLAPNEWGKYILPPRDFVDIRCPTNRNFGSQCQKLEIPAHAGGVPGDGRIYLMPEVFVAFLEYIIHKM